MVEKFFFFNDTATTEIYTLSLHDALPIWMRYFVVTSKHHDGFCLWDSQLTDYKATHTPARQDLLRPMLEAFRSDRKSTRLNSSHANISYAVFCLKKKKNACLCMNPIHAIT